jgi:hypothetical protein
MNNKFQINSDNHGAAESHEATTLLSTQKMKKRKLSKDYYGVNSLSRTTQVNSSPNISRKIHSTWDLEEVDNNNPTVGENATIVCVASPIRRNTPPGIAVVVDHQKKIIERFRPTSPIFKGASMLVHFGDERVGFDFGEMVSSDDSASFNSLTPTPKTIGCSLLTTPSPIRNTHHRLMSSDFDDDVTPPDFDEVVRDTTGLFTFRGDSLNSPKNDMFEYGSSSFNRNIPAPWPLV